MKYGDVVDLQEVLDYLRRQVRQGRLSPGRKQKKRDLALTFDIDK
jgi:DNA-binding GntR family transcriptional regulator